MKRESTAENVVALRTRIFDVCLAVVGSRDDAEDLSSEAIVHAIANLGGFREDAALYTWVYRIAVNLSKNFLVREGRRRKHADVRYSDEPGPLSGLMLGDILPDDAWSTDPAILYQRKELRLRLLWAIMREGRRLGHGAEYIVAHYFLGMSCEEIAIQFGVTVQSVKSKLFRTRQRIGLYLSGYV